MPLTLDEITEHEKRARREIAERECLLAALKVLRGYTTQGDKPAPTDAPFLLSDLIPITSEAGWKELENSPPAEPAPMPLVPAEPPAPRYIHPELEAIGNGHASINKAVAWGIRRMTDDYTARDLDELLTREGDKRGTAQVSLVLSRMRQRGEIEQLRPSSGPNPAVYRKPASPQLPPQEPEVATSGGGE